MRAEVVQINTTNGTAPQHTRVADALSAEDSSVRLRAALAVGSNPDLVFLETLVERCAVEPEARFLVPLVSRPTRDVLERAVYAGDYADLPITLMSGHATAALQAGIPSRPTLLDEDDRDLIEEAEGPVYPAEPGTTAYGRPAVHRPSGATEVIEDLYEQP